MCRDRCVCISVLQPAIFPELQIEFALRQKFFPAERTYFGNHPQPNSLNLNAFHYLPLRGRQGLSGVATRPLALAATFKIIRRPPRCCGAF